VLNPAAEVCEVDADCTGGDVCSGGCACIPPPVCGNGVIESGEECDDAGASGTCDADCTAALCGDATTNPLAGEQCESAAECGAGESCLSCGCGPAGQSFFDDFDRAALGANWQVDAGSFAIQSNQLVENSGATFLDAQLRWVGGTTATSDQFAKLRITLQNTHTSGFMFRLGDPSGHHYEVHLPAGSAEWRWELYDPGFVGRVGDCIGDQAAANGNVLAARIDGSGADTLVSVWRWDTDPGNDPSTWGEPDCQMSQDPATPVDLGTSLGLRSYTGGSPVAGFADDWSAGDSTVPIGPIVPRILQILDASGAGTPNSVRDPDGVALDSQGNLFVGVCGLGPSDQGVFKIAPDLQVTKVMGAEGDGVHAADCPVGVDVDSGDNVYVAAFLSNNVFRITPSGTVEEVLDSSGAGSPDSLLGVIDVAIDSADNLYASGWLSDRVIKRTPAGVITEVLGPEGDGNGNALVQPFGLSVDSGDHLIVPGFGLGSDAVFKVAPDGGVTVILDGSGDGLGSPLVGPHATAVDVFDNVFVTGNSSDNVFKITPQGQISVILDAAGDGQGNALDNPTGIAVDPAGNVYVNGFFSSNVFRVTPAGVVTEILDPTGDGIHDFFRPADVGICVDANGTVFTAGTDSDNVFRILPPP